MNIKNLSFFDNKGYNLNFEWNETLGVWEGIIYLPKVSVGLYANTNIYVMEKVGNEYFFPQKGGSDDTIKFSWDILNTFVDEFFMFDFDMGYYASNEFDTSALIYKPNNGPEAETLIVKRFDEYEVELDDTNSRKALPIHVAFSSPAKYDATTFKRTLDMYYGRKKIACITFFAETIEEDERLKVLNRNMGYDIKPKDTIIFKDSDIKECYPDYSILNEKRKELMIEGHNIYPYIGSYKAIVNVIKFFGYENLNIIEYWRNVDVNSDYFGKVFATSKYKLTNKETLNVKGQEIPLPNRNYRKLNNISLVYTINHPVDEYDDLEIPLVVEDFDYTMEEVMIKLFALRRKLNDEFMPCSSRIVDIIGEGTYFGLEELVNTTSNNTLETERNRVHHPSIRVFPSGEVFTPTLKRETIDGTETVYDYRENAPEDFVFPTCVTHISENRGFIQYLTEMENESDFADNNTYELNQNTTLSSIANLTLENIASLPGNDMYLDSSYSEADGFTNHFLADEYEEFCSLVGEGYREDNPFEPAHHNEHGSHEFRPTAKVVLENLSFNEVTFGMVLDTFGSLNNNITFGNINTTYYGYDKIMWSVRVSDDQTDDDLARLGIEKTYEPGDFTRTTNLKNIDEYKKVMLELPFAGYYDIEMKFSGTAGEVTYVFEKAIKVELYNLDIRGFYYDARELPEDLQYNMDSYGMTVGDIDEGEEINKYKKFIMARLKTMTTWATIERIDGMYDMDIDQSMPLYGEDSDSGEMFVAHPGPYGTGYINTHWCLLDNINWNITSLKPELNLPNARYIKNAVDVKPYTWFLLGFEESKITSIENPKWTLTNLATGEWVEHTGNYFTILLKKEGDYRIDLELDDTNGNHYSVSRVIVIVDKKANYRLYRRFKEDYDAYVEERDRIDARLYSEFATLNTMVDEGE